MQVKPADPWAALRSLRIGCVKYLNSRPLICAYDGPVVFDHPSSLAQMLSSGKLDAALVPAFEALRTPGYTLVDGAVVGSDGPVFSVFLAYRGNFRDIRSVSLDPASLSSANLLRVLLREFHDIRPVLGENGEALLLIGNQAIEFRLRNEARGDGWNFFDLGAEWKRCAGLPFVFALWALRPGIADVGGIAHAFRGLRECGVGQIPNLVANETFADRETRQRYLTEFIRFDLGMRGNAGLELYRELLIKHRLIEKSPEPLRFV